MGDELSAAGDSKAGLLIDRIYTIQSGILEIQNRLSCTVLDLAGPDRAPVAESVHNTGSEAAVEGMFPKAFASLDLISRYIDKCNDYLDRLID